MKQVIGIVIPAIALIMCAVIFQPPIAESGMVRNKIKIESEINEENQLSDDPLNLYAQSAVLMDAASGRVLYGKNETISRPMASTTKIMTCIVALEHGNLDDTVEASANAASQPKVHLGVRKGETFKLEDLLYSLMLESHNDAAVMIAEQVGGSVEGFAALMNQKARDLGCDRTYFITPNGLDAKIEDEGRIREHSTSAEDLGKIMNYCIAISPQREDFLKITQTQSYYFTDLEGKRSFSCTNHNALMTMMEGLLSGKTGFTGGAGYSYVASLEDHDRVFTIALLGCGWPPHKTYKWSDARKLFEYAKKNYEYREVYEEPRLPDIPIKNGIPSSGDLGERVEINCVLDPSQEKSVKLLMNSEETADIDTKLPDVLEAPVKKGQVVGSVRYLLEGKTVKIYPVLANEDVEKLTLSWCVKRIVYKWLSMPGLLAFFGG